MTRLKNYFQLFVLGGLVLSGWLIGHIQADHLIVPEGETIELGPGTYEYETADIRGEIKLRGDTTIIITYGLDNEVPWGHRTLILNKGRIYCDFHVDEPSSPQWPGDGRDGYDLTIIVHGHVATTNYPKIDLYGHNGGWHGSFRGGNGGDFKLICNGWILPYYLQLVGNGFLVNCRGGWSGSAVQGIDGDDDNPRPTPGGPCGQGGDGGNILITAQGLWEVRIGDSVTPGLLTSGGNAHGGGGGGDGGDNSQGAQGGLAAGGGGNAGDVTVLMGCELNSRMFHIRCDGGRGGMGGSPGRAGRVDGGIENQMDGLDGYMPAGKGGDGGLVTVNAAWIKSLWVKAVGGKGGQGACGAWVCSASGNEGPVAGDGGNGAPGGAGGSLSVTASDIEYIEPPDVSGGEGGIAGRGGRGGDYPRLGRFARPGWHRRAGDRAGSAGHRRFGSRHPFRAACVDALEYD